MECTERDSTEANDMQTPAKVDVQSLLDEIAALKQCVKEANDEVSELKSALNNPIANKNGLNASPVDEVLLCSKSTCDTTLITCSSRNNDEYNYDYGNERGEMNADDICANGRDCFGGKFAKMFSAIFTNKKRMLTEAQLYSKRTAEMMHRTKEALEDHTKQERIHVEKHIEK